MGRRTTLLLLSIIVAALGTGAVALYARNADQRAQRGVQMVSVYVAAQNVAADTLWGSAVNSKLIELRDLPRDALAPDAVLSGESLAGQRAVHVIEQGQQIVRGAFSKAAAAKPPLLPVSPDHQAVSVTLTEAASVAGWLQAGSLVTVYRVAEDNNLPAEELLHSVLVLAVGDQRGRGDTVTFDVTSDEAKKLVGASQGTLYLGLPSSPAAASAG